MICPNISTIYNKTRMTQEALMYNSINDDRTLIEGDDIRTRCRSKQIREYSRWGARKLAAADCDLEGKYLWPQILLREDGNVAAIFQSLINNEEQPAVELVGEFCKMRADQRTALTNVANSLQIPNEITYCTRLCSRVRGGMKWPKFPSKRAQSLIQTTLSILCVRKSLWQPRMCHVLMIASTGRAFRNSRLPWRRHLCLQRP